MKNFIRIIARAVAKALILVGVLLLVVAPTMHSTAAKAPLQFSITGLILIVLGIVIHIVLKKHQ